LPGLRFSAPLEAAVPVSATFRTSTSVLTVKFNHLLTDAAVGAGNFEYFDGVDKWLLPAPGVANMRTFVGTMQVGPPDATPASCKYNAVPADVVDRNTLPVVAFSGFPVTVI